MNYRPKLWDCLFDMKKLNSALILTRNFFLSNDKPWIIGYSGGKDSSLIIKIILKAISLIPKELRRPVQVFYCDTGVEIPVLRNYIKESLEAIQTEGISLGIEISVKAVRPPLSNHFFVKVIGRGYPPPSNKFRWCTDRLRIDPIQVAIKESVGNSNCIVVLGTRYEESEERTRTLERHATDNEYFFNQTGHKNTILFCPIADFSTEDVWEALYELNEIKSINIHQLSTIYKLISGECPIIKMPDSNPCSKGRFGCWTCTVIRKDKATKNMIDNGFYALRPLYDFRQWLLDVRDLPSFRCNIRRNGGKGLGPFRLSARKIILEKLLEAQEKSNYDLISTEELSCIYKLWADDLACEKYREDF